MDSKLTIVIVNFQSWGFLSQCIESLLNQNSGPPKIIVVDNFSNDGMLINFKKKYTFIKWIELEYNSGFSKACNIGAKYVETSWMLFLNPDSVLPRNCLTDLITFCQNNKELKIISVRVKNNFLNQSFSHGFYFNFWTVSNFIRQFYIFFSRGNKKQQIINGKKVFFTGWVSGAFLLIRKKDFTRVGGWDEDYWMYAEDMDFCKRALDYNLRSCVIHDLHYHHTHGGSSRKNEKIKLITKAELTSSKHIFIEKHLQGIEKRTSHVLLIFTSFIELALLFPFSGFHRSLLFKLIKYWRKSISAKTWKSLYREEE